MSMTDMQAWRDQRGFRDKASEAPEVDPRDTTIAQQTDLISQLQDALRTMMEREELLTGRISELERAIPRPAAAAPAAPRRAIRRNRKV